MVSIEDMGRSLKICNLPAIVAISKTLSDIERLVEFSDKYGIPRETMLSSLSIVLRAFMQQHIAELDFAQIVGIRASREYLASVQQKQHPHRPRKALLDKLAYCAHEKLRPLWSAHKIGQLKHAYESARDYFEVIESFFLRNIVLVVEGTENQVDSGFLAIASGMFFSDSVLEYHKSRVLYDYAPHKKGAEYLQQNWRGYVAVVGFFYKCLLEQYLGNYYLERIMHAKDLRELSSIGEELWRNTIDLLDREIGTDEWSLRTRPTIDLSMVESFVAKNCSVDADEADEDLANLLGYHRLVLIDGRSKYFAGPASFVRLVYGEIAVRKQNVEVSFQPVEIVRFVHPVSEEGGNSFSYAVLIGSDPPGWVVFTSCANDYSKGSTKTAKEIEHHLQKLGDLVDVKELQVSYAKLEEYALSRTTVAKGPLHYLTDGEALRVLFRKARGLMKCVSGKLLELLVVAIFSKCGYLVNWSLRSAELRELEIDVVARSDKVCYVVECSHRMKRTDQFAADLVSEFCEKETRLSMMDGFEYEEYRRMYVTRAKHFQHEDMAHVIEFLEQNQIEVVSIEDLIEVLELDKKDEVEMIRILQEVDCWKQGSSEWSTGSNVRDVLTCLDTVELPYLGTIGPLDHDDQIQTDNEESS